MLRPAARLAGGVVSVLAIVGGVGPAVAGEMDPALTSATFIDMAPTAESSSQSDSSPGCIIIAGYCQGDPSCADSACNFPLSIPGKASEPGPPQSQQQSVPTSAAGEAPPPQAPPPDCWSVELPDIPVGTAAVWQGHTAADGYVAYQVCREGVEPTIRVPFFVAFPAPGDPAQPAAPPPPDPAVLAEEAISRLQIPMPDPHFGPDRSTIAVQLWTWLWIDASAPVTSTVELQGVSVTATATLESTTWNLGEPAARDTGEGFRSGPAATVTCSGAGAPYDASVDWKAEPPCGHQFRWRSTDDRTGGSGRWPVAVTTTWGVTWQASTGQTGTATLTGTAADAVQVSEYRILLTPGG